MVERYSTVNKRAEIANTAGMIDVFRVMNEMVEDGIIKDYVIGGGAATSLYAVPYLTEDIDFFCYYNQSSIFIILDPLFEYLKERGGKWVEKEGNKKFILGLWPIDFTPDSTPLVKEAMENANKVVVGGVSFKLFTPEYLVAVALETGRKKDERKSIQLLEHKKVDISKLEEILTKHNLIERWNIFKTAEGF